MCSVNMLDYPAVIQPVGFHARKFAHEPKIVVNIEAALACTCAACVREAASAGVCVPLLQHQPNRLKMTGTDISVAVFNTANMVCVCFQGGGHLHCEARGPVLHLGFLSADPAQRLCSRFGHLFQYGVHQMSQKDRLLHW